MSSSQVWWLTLHHIDFKLEQVWLWSSLKINDYRLKRCQQFLRQKLELFFYVSTRTHSTLISFLSSTQLKQPQLSICADRTCMFFIIIFLLVHFYETAIKLKERKKRYDCAKKIELSEMKKGKKTELNLSRLRFWMSILMAEAREGSLLNVCRILTSFFLVIRRFCYIFEEKQI